MEVQSFIYDTFLARMPILADDPFVHIMFDVPGVIGQPAPFWRYWISTLCVGPLFFLVAATLLSLYTGEWAKRASMRREAWISVKGLIVTSPFIAWVFKGFVEGRWGHFYYAVADEPFAHYTVALQALLFFVVADARAGRFCGGVHLSTQAIRCARFFIAALCICLSRSRSTWGTAAFTRSRACTG